MEKRTLEKARSSHVPINQPEAGVQDGNLVIICQAD